MRKKIFSLLLVLVMALCLTAGAEVTPKGTLPIVTEPTTLRVAVPVPAQVEDIHTNAFTLWLEEQTGVDLDIIVLSSSDASTQVNTMMLSGDLPDMFMNYSFTYEELASYVDAGLIARLDPYIEQYGDEYFNFLDQFAPYAGGKTEAFVTVDDGVYAVPVGGGMVTNIYLGKKFRIQGSFLQALDMEMPTTLDDLYAFLVAVRDTDVNRNGDASDEIPMTGHSGSIFLAENIGNAFQYTDSNTYLKLNNGTVEFVANNELFKETVEYIRMLVAEQLLDPAIFTQDSSILLTMNTMEEAIIGVDASYSSGSYDASSQVFGDLLVMPNLTGPHGYSSTHISMPKVVIGLVITSACEQPEVAFRLCDFLLTDEAGVHARLGVEGEHWEAALEGENGRDGEAAWYRLIGTQVWTWPTNNAIWRAENFFHSDVMNHVAEDPESSIGKLAAAVRSHGLEAATTGEQLPSLLFDTETAAEYNEMLSMIRNYVRENFAKFVLGDQPMSQWDAYCADLEAMGVSHYVQMTQDAYDAMYK